MHQTNDAAVARKPELDGRQIDLNLLFALRALLAEKHVTRAASRIGLTQPAMSHALGRLRTTLGDPLLIRTGPTMVLTARAAELVEPLERLLGEVSRLLEPPHAFDPARATRSFRVGASDYAELVVMPAVLAHVWREAPGINVQMRPLVGSGAEDLDEERLDVVLGPALQTTAKRQTLLSRRLFNERFVCVVREGHPALAGGGRAGQSKRLTLEKFLELPHALISPRGRAGGIVDSALAKLGKRRRIAVEVPHFLVAPFLLQGTDLVLTVAERVALALDRSVKIRALEPPRELALEGFDISIVWHPRDQNDVAHAWFRKKIAEAAKDLR